MAKQSVELRTIGKIQALLAALEDESSRYRVLKYVLESSGKPRASDGLEEDRVHEEGDE
jgi:hypothetical protein